MFYPSFLGASPRKREATPPADSRSSHNCHELQSSSRSLEVAFPLRGRKLGDPPTKLPGPEGGWVSVRIQRSNFLSVLPGKAVIYSSSVLWLLYPTCPIGCRSTVLLCREVPGLCSKAAPGCFGWFGGKLWSLHHLFQTGGPWWLTVGDKAGH